MPHYFDAALPRVGSADLKPMVKAWGGDYKMRKDECIAYLSAALKDPQKIQATLANLQPWERNALALLKHMGGVMNSSALTIGVKALGEYPKHPVNHYQQVITRDLFRLGLVMALDTRNPEYFGDSYYGHYGIAYSDDRILAQVGFPKYKLFDLKPESVSGENHFRRPAAVTLDVIGLLQTLENMGGLKLTQNGTLRNSDEIKIRKAQRWREEDMDVDGFLFPNPLQALLEAFSFSNLLKKSTDGQLTLAESPTRFAQRPPVEQVRLLMEGLIHAKNWWEISNTKTYWDSSGAARLQGRLALTLALSALPLNPDGFYSLQKFELALFQRIGNDFSLGNIASYPSFYRKETPAEQDRQITEWQATIRSQWLKQEVPWLVSAFTTWLYFLGLVELLMNGNQLVGFRLTDLGRETLHPELPASNLAGPSLQTTPIGPAWVVQPNFDIIVYMDRVNAPQLAFLERCAERSQAQKHTAHYRLTRESIYRGLESGLTLDNLVSTLQIGSQTELSQNILVELREWAALRERIFLRKQANLLEFSSPHALKAGQAQGIKGTIVADRFLLLHATPPALSWDEINYAETLPPNLTLTETGHIEWKPTKHPDLLTAVQLDQWAESTTDGSWQLTRESIRRALKPGRKLSELLSLLQNRVFPTRTAARKYELPPPSIPALLELALRSWAGTSYPITLQNVILIQCPSEKIYQAVIASPLMKSLLKGHRAPDLLFADPAQIETLRQQLAWLGWKVTDDL
ncbi:MAG: helicase-associated domain-containing protein [Chloroflexota bacterium]